jgi:uncharacterized protein YuzE
MIEPSSSYDPVADALFISLAPIAPGELYESVPYAPSDNDTAIEIYLHFDRHRRLRGIEILAASQVLPDASLSFDAPSS